MENIEEIDDQTSVITYEAWKKNYKPRLDDNDQPIDFHNYNPKNDGICTVEHIWTLLEFDESTDHIPDKYKNSEDDEIDWDAWHDDPEYKPGISSVIVSGYHYVNRLETYICSIPVADNEYYEVVD